LQDFYFNVRKVAKTYLDVLQLRMSITQRIADINATNPASRALKFLTFTRDMLLKEQKRLLEGAKELFSDHPLWAYCTKIKGFGEVACLTFLGYIDPYKATSAGKARAYFGVIPGYVSKKGLKVNYNREAKGRLWMITVNVIRKKDPFYYPLYLKKKEYYYEREFKYYIEDPSKCPNFEECTKRLERRAKIRNQPMKKHPCKAHLDTMAKKYLAGLIVSHALEIMRAYEGLPIDHFKTHRNYIPPPLHVK